MTPDERAAEVAHWIKDNDRMLISSSAINLIAAEVRDATSALTAANVRLVQENTELTRLNASAIHLLTELWEYYAPAGKDGKLWPGGLSLLEDLDRLLHSPK
jgi:hypothetical protein